MNTCKVTINWDKLSLKRKTRNETRLKM